MISTSDRQAAVALIEEAVGAGARKRAACEEMGIALRTLERWVHSGEVREDGRPTALRPSPAHALSAQERAEVLRIVNEPRFAALPPTQIVPRLADEGRYLASESTLYRILRAEQQLTLAAGRARRCIVSRRAVVRAVRISCGVGTSRICPRRCAARSSFST